MSQQQNNYLIYSVTFQASTKQIIGEREGERLEREVRERREEEMETEGGEERVQHVVVMRHGDRIDHFNPNWVSQAARPWDPVLTDGGKARARATGARLSGLDFPIHRVLVSPFVRCRETAAEVVTSLCPVGEIDGQDSPIDPSRVKVLIQKFR